MNPAHGGGRFATTHWSLVLAAAREEDRDGSLAAVRPDAADDIEETT
jgi:hypothetical protein